MSESLYSDGTIEFRILTKERLEDALRVQAISMQQENVANGVGMFEEPGAPQEMQLIFKEIAKDGISVIAMNTQSKRVIAVAFNKMHVALKDGEKDPLAIFVEKNVKHESCLQLVRFLDHVESKVNVLEAYGVEAVMEIFYVGTDPTYRQCGVGRRMIEACVRVASMLRSGQLERPLPLTAEEKLLYERAIPNAVYAIFTSNYTQRIAEKLNFVPLAEFSYQDFAIRGKRMSERIGNVHKSAKLAFLKL